MQLKLNRKTEFFIVKFKHFLLAFAFVCSFTLVSFLFLFSLFLDVLLELNCANFFTVDHFYEVINSAWTFDTLPISEAKLTERVVTPGEGYVLARISCYGMIRPNAHVVRYKFTSSFVLYPLEISMVHPQVNVINTRIIECIILIRLVVILKLLHRISVRVVLTKKVYRSIVAADYQVALTGSVNKHEATLIIPLVKFFRRPKQDWLKLEFLGGFSDSYGHLVAPVPDSSISIEAYSMFTTSCNKCYVCIKSIPKFDFFWPV